MNPNLSLSSFGVGVPVYQHSLFCSSCPADHHSVIWRLLGLLIVCDISKLTCFSLFYEAGLETFTSYMKSGDPWDGSQASLTACQSTKICEQQREGEQHGVLIQCTPSGHKFYGLCKIKFCFVLHLE